MPGALPDEVYAPPRSTLPELTEETRAIVARAQARRLALMSDQQQLRARYEEVMRWINPPWDPVSMRVDPRPERATAARQGQNLLHIDKVGQVVTRWAALEAGAMFIFRCKPPVVHPPVDSGDPGKFAQDRKKYDIDRAIAQNTSTQVEEQTQDWMDVNNLHRTLLWACWSKEAFGKAILRSGWDDTDGIPTVELLENPSQVYYAWTKRYGRRRLAWALVVDQMSPEEANARFDLQVPLDTTGAVDLGSWTGTFDMGDMDQRGEQQAEVNRYVFAEEFWELTFDDDPARAVRYALIVAGRVVEGPYYYPWKRLPFHVLENEHIATYSHGKSVAEAAIAINEAYDDMLDRQAEVINFESGPRYKGLNMANSGDEVDIPDAFSLIPLGEGQDIQQIDTRVDFFPTQLHATELKDAEYKATGLTPVAWGMSPNAQTSGRALSAEWRAVELPLTVRLVNMTPDIKDVMFSWWDYAEANRDQFKKVAKGYRRFEVLWIPVDIRDQTEKTLDIIQRLNANLVDPETAIEETGKQNVDEIMAKIKAYLMDPIYNPLRYQQYLTLQQLELQIRQTELQIQQQEQMTAAAAAQGAPAPGAQPAPGDLQAQGTNAAAQAAQGPAGPITEANNQAGGLPIDTSILSQTPLEGGIGNRAIVGLGGQSPTAGNVPQ
jgi:hypothetical protein